MPKKPKKNEKPLPSSNQRGITSFFQKKAETNNERRTPEAAKIPETFDIPEHIPRLPETVKPKPISPQRRKSLRVVAPPPFLPIRTTTDTTGFLHRLKVREFVLQCIFPPRASSYFPLANLGVYKVEKLFTRKLHVPTKHIIQLADPCDTPPALTIKHLFAALFRIVQADFKNKDDQDLIKETIRKIEKSAAGNKVIKEAVMEWLAYMDPKVMSQLEGKGKEADDIHLAAILIDWAISSTTCRNEMETNLETLRILKNENTASLKTLRTGSSPSNPLPPHSQLTFRIGNKESRII
jgi:hypothetical protein